MRNSVASLMVPPWKRGPGETMGWLSDQTCTRCVAARPLYNKSTRPLSANNVNFAYPGLDYAFPVEIIALK